MGGEPRSVRVGDRKKIGKIRIMALKRLKKAAKHIYTGPSYDRITRHILYRRWYVYSSQAVRIRIRKDMVFGEWP